MLDEVEEPKKSMKVKKAAKLSTTALRKTPKVEIPTVKASDTQQRTGTQQQGVRTTAHHEPSVPVKTMVAPVKSRILEEVKRLRMAKGDIKHASTSMPDSLNSGLTEQHSELKMQTGADPSPTAIKPVVHPSQAAVTQIAKPPGSAPFTKSLPPKAHSRIPLPSAPKPSAPVSPATPSSSSRSEVAKRPAIYPLPSRAAPVPIKNTRTLPTRAFPQVSNETMPQKYKAAARRVTLAIVAMPIAIVTSWVLYDRSTCISPVYVDDVRLNGVVVLGTERKLLVRSPGHSESP